MSWRTTVARVLGFVRRTDVRDRELHDEIRSHIELETDENIERGMDPVEARRAALLRFGSPQLAHEQSRGMWSLPSLESVLSDMKFGWRVLWKSPGVAGVAVLTLAVGIGSSTAVFTVGNAVMLRRMPYPEPDRIVLVWGSDGKGLNRGQVSFTDIEDVRRRNRVFSSIANFADWTPTLSGVGEPERLAATQVSDGFFDVIGIGPAIGRAFTAEEHVDGRDRVVILSHGLWKRRFNADPAIIGRAIQFSSVPHLVIGVMPENFEGLPSTLVQGGELYRPIGESYDDTQRRSEHLRAIARLNPGVTIEKAQSDVERIARALEAEHPKEDANLHFSIATLQEDTAHELKPSIVVLSWAVLMLLLIACSNVAGLLLARSSSRQKEFALRTALGAPRSRILRQALTESAVLASLGGALGLGIAHAATQMSAALAPKIGSPLAHASVDPTVLAFTACAVLFTAVIFGLAPALHAAGNNISTSIKQGGQFAEISRGGRRFHTGIVIGELALALTMLTTAALLVQTFIGLQRVEIGFQTDDRLVMNVWIPESKYRAPELRVDFFDELLRRVSALPGVNSAALVQNPPLGNYDGRGMLPEGRVDSPENYLSPQTYIATPDYLRTMGIPLITGRAFSAADNESSEPVAIVSQSLADTMFPGQEAIGRKLQLFSDEKINGKYPFRTIVGVVGDVRHLGPDERMQPGLYIPYRQLPISWMSLVVHASKPMALVPSIRRELSAVDPDIAAFRIGTYAEFLADALLIRRIAMILIAAFGATALFLAGVGLYGLLSFVVSLRNREFGVRAAVGALPRDLVHLVLGSGLRLLIAGAGIGLACSVLAMRVAASVISGTAEPDAATLAVSVAILFTVAFVAIVLPARAAGQVDPASTLRAE